MLRGRNVENISACIQEVSESSYCRGDFGRSDSFIVQSTWNVLHPSLLERPEVTSWAQGRVEAEGGRVEDCKYLYWTNCCQGPIGGARQPHSTRNGKIEDISPHEVPVDYGKDFMFRSKLSRCLAVHYSLRHKCVYYRTRKCFTVSYRLLHRVIYFYSLSSDILFNAMMIN